MLYLVKKRLKVAHRSDVFLCELGTLKAAHRWTLLESENWGSGLYPNHDLLAKADFHHDHNKMSDNSME